MNKADDARALDDLRIAANAAVVRSTIGRWVLHELRGPIQNVSLVAQMMSDGGAPVEASLRQIVAEDGQRVRELLDVLARLLGSPSAGRPQGGRREGENNAGSAWGGGVGRGGLAPIALGGVIDMVALLQHCHRGTTKLEVDRNAIGALPAVRGSVDDLLHVMVNLLLNATEAQRAGVPGVIRIGAALTGDAAGGAAGALRVVVAFEDDGPGLTPEAEAIWSVNEIGEADLPHPHDMRLGLGLPVARLLARRMGGSLVADRRRGGALRAGDRASVERGARFLLTLPVWSG